MKRTRKPPIGWEDLELDFDRLYRVGDPYTSMEAARNAFKSSKPAIVAVAHLMQEGLILIDEEIGPACRVRGFGRTPSTIRHARLALSAAKFLLFVGKKQTVRNRPAHLWVWHTMTSGLSIPSQVEIDYSVYEKDEDDMRAVEDE